MRSRTTKLKYVARFSYGDTRPPTNDHEGSVPVFGSNGPFAVTSLPNTGSPAIVVGRKGSYGKVSWSSEACFASDTTFFIDSRTCHHHLRWLFWLLQTLQLDEGTDEAAVPGLRLQVAYSRDVVVPPPAEQQAIAAFLDRETARVDALVERKEHLVGLLKERRTAIISHAVTSGLDPEAAKQGTDIDWLGEIPAHWDVRRLKSFATVSLSNVDKKSIEGQSSVRLCNYVDVYNAEAIDAGLDFMSATATPEQVRRFSLRRGDVLVTKDSETWLDIAVPALVSEDLPAVLCGYHLAHIRPSEECDGGYLTRCLGALCVRDQFHVRANGVTRFGLTGAALANGVLPLPPIAEQQAIAAFLDRETAKIDALIAKVREAIERLEEYRAALISAAVTGNIDVRGEAAL